MYRIILSADDIMSIRVSETSNPIMEAVFALQTLHGSGHDGFGEWRLRVGRHLMRPGARIQRMANLVRTVSDPDRLLALCAGEGPSDSGKRGGGNASQIQSTAAIQDFFRLAVAPHWGPLSAHLTLAGNMRREVMSREGVRVLLDALGPDIRWNAPALEIHNVEAGELELNGTGLVLAPSIFLTSTGHVVRCTGKRAREAPVLFFPDRPAPEELGRLLSDTTSADEERGTESDGLAALLGRTRAAALRVLREREGWKNAELAERLGVSAAAVSQHTTVLRAAGLIATRRNRSHVVHTVTHLGRLLLQVGSFDSWPTASGSPVSAPRPTFA
ncbi:winged helix-turn-helix domain-containing protein [Streptomyces sp. NPDC127108]|uniref:winged helix-turn-helix domain-containing protein n=1 Tax=Streptomyces sp. NPDC127108 TaxID=3345361 RepID=UPI003629F704